MQSLYEATRLFLYNFCWILAEARWQESDLTVVMIDKHILYIMVVYDIK